MTTRNSDPPRSGEPSPELGPFVRLVDDPRIAPRIDSATDPSASAWALDLLRSAEPSRSPVARKQRVQLRLGHIPRRKAPLALRAAIALIVLAGCGAFASAALGRWPAWIVRAYERIVPPTAPPAPAPAGERRARPTRPVAVEEHAPAVEPRIESPWPAVATPLPSSAPASPHIAAHPRHGVATAGQHPQHAEDTEDTSPVLEAMRALRREHNPVRARALLALYLDRHPTGTLAEEALALSIEAAVAHQDPDAAGLAARYLRHYPTGLFRTLARQTLSAAAQQP